MKKLAIIGSSNAIMHTGYAKEVQRLMPGQCDIYALGSATSAFAVYSILNAPIINNYEFVVLEFCLNDSDQVSNGNLCKEIIISYLIYIIHKCLHSKTKLIFLALPCLKRQFNDSLLYIYNALSRMYSIPIIDICTDFIFIPKNTLAKDGFHYFPVYQTYIAERIISLLRKKCPPPRTTHNNTQEKYIRYSLLPLNFGNAIEIQEKGTSLIKHKVLNLTANNIICIPKDKYLTAIMYWTGTSLPFLKVANKSIGLFKNMNHGKHNIFLFRSIGWSIRDGLSGCSLTVTSDKNDLLYETTAYESSETITNVAIPIAAILVSDLPPVIHGEQFYITHKNIFIEEQQKQISFWHDTRQEVLHSLYNKLDQIIRDGASIFRRIVAAKPDLARTTLSGTENLAERLLFWTWRYGRHELVWLDSELQSKIEDGLYALHKQKYNFAYPAEYSMLVHSMWLARDDIREKYQPQTYEGLKSILGWFYKYAVKEYELENIIRISIKQ